MYRLFLSLLVVLAHLGGAGGFSAGYAVYSFYMLSGWLMTTITNQRYGFTVRGFTLYCTNRALRIYPLYWVGCVLSIVMIASFGQEAVASFHKAIVMPGTFSEIMSNMFIFGLRPDVDGARLVPPTWAIYVELVYYVAIGAVLGRSYRIAKVWFFISALYHVVAFVYPMDRYYGILAASLPFSIGALIYHMQNALRKAFPFSIKRLLVASLAYVTFLVVTQVIFTDVRSQTRLPFYANLLLWSVVIHYASQLKIKSKLLLYINKISGDASYPVYLYHYGVGFIVLEVFDFTPKTITFFIITVPILLIISISVAMLADGTLERIRKRVSEKAEMQNVM